MIYDPAEDSFLLQKYAKKYAAGLVLDMGTGSGIQAVAAAEKADFVVGLDIDKESVKYCQKNIHTENIAFFKSNLFQIFTENFFVYNPVDKKLGVYPHHAIKDPDQRKLLAKKPIKFDVILFNPPYLPRELPEADQRLEGGEEGYETLMRFFNAAEKYLRKDGKIILVFSSFTHTSRVNAIIRKAGFRYISLEQQHIFFEDLFVYYVTKE